MSLRACKMLPFLRYDSSVAEKSGYDVNYVQNFTDIDDKIINRANETGIDWKKLVDDNIESYYKDMDSLNILRADSYPRCTNMSMK